MHEALAPLRAAGVPADDEQVQEVVALHHRAVSLYWTPNADAYRGLGDMYPADERSHPAVRRGDRGLVEYLRDAMAAYADTRLSG